MIDYFLFVSLTTALSFWSARPVGAALVMLMVLLFESAATNEIGGETLVAFSAWRPLLVLLSAFGGYSLSAGLGFDGIHLHLVSLRFVVTAAIAAAGWILTALSWQLFPSVFWNQAILVLVGQVVLVLWSWLFVPWDRACGTRGKTHIWNFWFFVSLVVCIDVPMVTAQLVNDPNFGQLYAAIVAAGSSALVGVLIFFAAAGRHGGLPDGLRKTFITQFGEQMADALEEGVAAVSATPENPQ